MSGADQTDAVSSDPSGTSDAPSPYLRILRGHPTDAELAALVVALQGLGANEPTSTPTPTSGWAAYWRAHRPPVQPGPGVWRHSLR